MIARRRGSGAIWAVMGMEVALAAPLVSLLVGIPDRPTLLGPATCVALMVLGYAFFFAPLPGLPRYRVAYAVVICFAARLLVTSPPSATEWPVLLLWLLAAIVPTLVGLVFWWRGSYLAEAELAAADVRNEFTVVGGGLIVLLTLFRGLVAADPTLATSAVVLFVLSGLIAVGTVRQDDAGSAAEPSARGLVTAVVLVFAAAGVALVGLLRPSVVATLWSAVQRALGLLGELLAFLLQPLIALLSRLHFEPPSRELPARPVGLPNIQDLVQRQPLPPWLTWLLLGLFALLALVVVIGVLWLLFAVILPGWLRPRTRARSPLVVEATGEGWDDARQLLARLGGWLAQLRGRAGAPRGRSADADALDARGIYRAYLRWAREHGFERSRAETPRELAARLSDARPLDIDAVAQLTDAYEHERYGQKPPRQPIEVLRALLARLREPPADEPLRESAR